MIPPEAGPPKVSVIVPVYDCLPTVAEALESALEQSMPPELVEVIAVDDGSTDGSDKELARLAGLHPRLTVLRRANSGGSGGPRNVGIERARGEYLFFLDADDRLGPQALERMCAVGDEQGTDIVIGNYVGVGRGAPRFTDNIPHVTVDDPHYDIFRRSLSAQKLFRRTLVDEHRLRFPEDAPSGQDKVFTVHALLHSAGVSVVADYDCYYLVERQDGTSMMQRGGAPPEIYYPTAARRLLEQVVSHRPPGPIRDRMLVRLFHRDVLHRFNDRYLLLGEDVRRRTVENVRALCDEFLTDAVRMGMPPRFRLFAHCVQHGLHDLIPEIIEADLADEPVPLAVAGDRAHVRYPGYGDPEAAIPDACFDVTDRLPLRRVLTSLEWDGDVLRAGGTAAIDRLPAAGRAVTLPLRSRKSGAEHLPVTRIDGDAFTADLTAGPGAHGGPPSSGTWDLHVRVAHGDLVKEGRVGADRSPDLALPEGRFVHHAEGTGAAVVPFLTDYGNLSFTVSPGVAGFRRLLRFGEIDWARDGLLRVRCHAAATPAAAAGVRLGVALDHRTRGMVRAGEVHREQAGDRLLLTALLDTRGLAAGRWDAWLEVASGGDRVRIRIPNAVTGSSDRVPCAPLGLRTVAFYRTEGGNLSVEASPGRLPTLARSAKGRLRAALPHQGSQRK
ncbi:glycosyltransferase family 2 protein [Actinomadura sp. WMMB 499]|uniref:glycosyltransferase family 2 protein n=1 Tax=Actinomadura sp. WMMB 499 TaxID=1219491 RepID=UPI00159DA9B5|nr:glycosyltransferase family 2 protein [Actinomadura sp. WMMB 499]